MTEKRDEAVEAALDQWTDMAKVGPAIRKRLAKDMRRAIAAWCLAKADAFGPYANTVGAPVPLWLREQAAELTQAADGRTG